MTNKGATELARKADENLLKAICSNPLHVLPKLFPRHRKSGYYMRARALYFELPTKDDTNHIAHIPLTNSFSMDRLNSDNLLENANLI